MPSRATAPCDSLLFDLDGTLWDSTETVAHAWNAVLQRRGDPHRYTPEDARSIMGKTHAEIHAALFAHLSPAEWDEVSGECYAEEIRQIAERGACLFAGVAEGVPSLARRYPLFIVSNCQQGYIEAFLAYSGLGGCVRDFECHGATGLPKAENLRLVVARNALRAPLYVGDMPSDAAAADGAAMPFRHARWGFGAVPERPGFADFAALVRHFLPEG